MHAHWLNHSSSLVLSCMQMVLENLGFKKTLECWLNRLADWLVHAIIQKRISFGLWTNLCGNSLFKVIQHELFGWMAGCLVLTFWWMLSSAQETSHCSFHLKTMAQSSSPQWHLIYTYIIICSWYSEYYEHYFQFLFLTRLRSTQLDSVAA